MRHCKLSAKPHRQWISGDQLRHFADSQTTAHRLCSGPDAWAERLGEDVLIASPDDAARDALRAELRQWSEEHGLAWQRVFGKLLPRHNEERRAPSLLQGDPALPWQTVVAENGMRFGLDFAAGYSVGLFLDQRANRALLRGSGARRVLNTFAYTCSFSVAAALGGAETVSVDLSKKSLDRGRENFRLNGLDPAAHRFSPDDVLELLPRFARKGERFDAIILDPPTFSRGHEGRRFQAEADFEELLIAALELAAPQARLLLSTNCATLTPRALQTLARFALKTVRRTAEFFTTPELPDIPAEHAARTLWLRLKS